jgi:hypothetical protein
LYGPHSHAPDDFESTSFFFGSSTRRTNRARFLLLVKVLAYEPLEHRSLQPFPCVIYPFWTYKKSLRAALLALDL